MCTEIFCWNVRGFNKSSHRRGFKKWFRKNNCTFGSLLETHVKQQKQQKFITSLLPGWLFDANYAYSDLGKIWVLWHPSVKVSVISRSLQMVTCDVQFPEAYESVIISFVYASNDVDMRQTLWNELTSLSGSQALIGKAWCVLGDFNQVLDPSENSFARSPNVDCQTRIFKQTLIDSSLVDLNFRGSSHTWWNKQKEQPIAKKLDRILVNDSWNVLFPLALGTFGPPAFSDHASMHVSLSSGLPKQKKPFRFFNFLLKNECFLPIIADCWFSSNVYGTAMFRVARKLKLLKPVIREFSKANYSGIEKRAAEAHEALILAQQRTLLDPSSANAAAELELQRTWAILSAAEEGFFLQKSRVTWLDVGDNNTPYFHRMASSRQAINHIHFLEDFSGNRIQSQSQIQDHCVEFFTSLLSPVVSPPLFEQSDITSLLNFTCSQAQQAEISATFTNVEIKEAFFSLPRNKASGPDGFPAEFFTSCWSVIGGEVVAAVQEFFSSGKLLSQLNATNLVLIPKITNASKMSDFRPISCLNTIYKVISRLLAGRLKSILELVISHSQTAFMPGRLLTENVLLATEIFHGYNKRNVERSAMLKVDLRKAFDSVRWDFVLATLRGLSIPDIFIGWIRQCICSPSFSLIVNGQSCGYFKGTQGLRQGDPLSPYLFVLTMEVFSGLLASRYDSGYICYHPKTHDLQISHLMFADDVMIFFDGGGSSLYGINETLEDFAGWSGLSMNRDKTQLFHAGLSQNETTELQSYGFSTGTLPIRYLGLPLMSRKLKISEYSPLLDKITSRFNSWSSKSLSFAGRRILISTVINGTVNFWSQTFTLPKGCIKRIETLCAQFLWSGSIDRRGNAKVAWASVCLPKSEGGLDLRRYANWNTTLLLRLIWLLFAGGGSLWVAWHKRHHCPTSHSFWSQTESQTHSWNWKCVLRLRTLAAQSYGVMLEMEE